MLTKNEIINQTIPILARDGYAGTSMRKIAAAIDKEPSNIYVHFANKESLLRETRLSIIKQLQAAQSIPEDADAAAMLRSTLLFQFQNREKIVALLQYFMTMRQDFPQDGGGYVPQRAYQHMRDVIDAGIAEGVYMVAAPDFDAKLTTHIVNGFLMEYFDHELPLTDQAELIERLAVFIEHGLQKHGAGHAA